ncbi:MAG: DUF2059 domain-containing protein [Janthinobacterium lividum]
MKTFYIRFGIALTAICFFINLNLKAQETDLTQSHLKAAEDMLVAMDMPNLITTNINNVVKVQSAALSPEKQKVYSAVMKTFMDKYLNWDNLKKDMSKVYASEFSESEIKQLTKFYQSPLGKKLIEKTPELMQKGMLVGKQVFIAHQAELQEMANATAQKESPKKP